MDLRKIEFDVKLGQSILRYERIVEGHIIESPIERYKLYQSIFRSLIMTVKKPTPRQIKLLRVGIMETLGIDPDEKFRPKLQGLVPIR